MFCCELLYVRSSFAIILVRKRELVALLCLSSWCLVNVWIFLAVPWVCLQFVIVVFPGHTIFTACNEQPPFLFITRVFMLKQQLHLFNSSSLQCYSVLSDTLVKNELCIPFER